MKIIFLELNRDAFILWKTTYDLNTEILTKKQKLLKLEYKRFSSALKNQNVIPL